MGKQRTADEPKLRKLSLSPTLLCLRGFREEAFISGFEKVNIETLKLKTVKVITVFFSDLKCKFSK